MRVVVPFAVETPKTRLSSTLDDDERAAFARAMLADVLAAVGATGHEPTVLATAPIEVDAEVVVDERPLTPAVDAALGEPPVAVVMADLPLATPAALDRLFDADADVVLAPGRMAGTNALLTRHAGFHVDYHGTSFLDHLGIAESVGASVAVIDSHRLATDVDGRDDLVEVLVHGEGAAAEWLRTAGFELAVEAGRVGLVRST